MDGAQESPAVTTNARGLTVLQLNYNLDTLRYDVMAVGLSGPMTNGHLHRGAFGVSGPVVVPFTGFQGNRVSGKSLAPDETSLRADLRRQGIAVTTIKKQSQAFKSGGKVKPEDIAVFSRQLATMLAAGIPLVQSFEIVGNGNEKPAMQKLILDIKADVEGGTSLHEALGKHPLHFDDLYVNLVEAGEQAGALETLLDKIATYKEKTEALKKKVKKALFYPAAVLCVAIIVTVILLLFVIPQFESLFKGFGAELPAAEM
jgi:type IV pilus assembly protein PilC